MKDMPIYDVTIRIIKPPCEYDKKYEKVTYYEKGDIIRLRSDDIKVDIYKTDGMILERKVVGMRPIKIVELVL